jgi:hypothetical protein
LVIVICLLFEICDLEFLINPADYRMKERLQATPSRGKSKLGPAAHSRLLNLP